MVSRPPAGGAGLLTARRVSVAFLAGASFTQLASNATAALVATVVLGPAQRGLMVVGSSLASVLAVVACLGTSAALRARLPLAAAPAGRLVLIGAYSWWTGLAFVVAAAGAAAATALSARIVDPGLADGAFLAAVAVFAVAQVGLLQVTEAWFADGRFRRGGTAAAVGAVGGLAGVLLAAAVSDSAAVLFLAQGIGSGAVAVVLLGRLRAAGLLALPRTGLRELGSMVAMGLPSLGLVVGLAVALRADRYVLGATAGVAAVGVYALAATLSEMPRLLPQAIGQLYLRDSALGFGADRLPGALRWATAAAAACGLAMAAAGWLLIEPLFGPEFAGARRLLLILVVAETCFAPFAIASRGLLGAGRTRAAGILGMTASVVAVAGYLLGAELGGAIGLAIATIGLYAALSAVSAMLIRRKARRT